MRRGLLLQHITIDPVRGGERVAHLPFLPHGPVDIQLRAPFLRVNDLHRPSLDRRMGEGEEQTLPIPEARRTFV